MRKKTGPTQPSWMERTGPSRVKVRALRPAAASFGLPTVGMLLAMTAFGCRSEPIPIDADKDPVTISHPVTTASKPAEPLPGMGALESYTPDPPKPADPVIAKIPIHKKVTPPPAPVMLGGAPPPVMPPPSAIVPTHPPSPPKGGLKAVHPTT